MIELLKYNLQQFLKCVPPLFYVFTYFSNKATILKQQFKNYLFALCLYPFVGSYRPNKNEF